jgi:hypothetical protein
LFYKWRGGEAPFINLVARMTPRTMYSHKPSAHAAQRTLPRRDGTPAGSEAASCGRAGAQRQFPEKTMTQDTRREDVQGTNTHKCTRIRTPVARRVGTLTGPTLLDTSPRTCTHEKHKKGSHKVPKDTNRDGITDCSRSGAKEGVDGRHLEHSADRKWPKQGLP